MPIKTLFTLSVFSLLLLYLTSCDSYRVYNAHVYQHKQNEAIELDSVRGSKTYYTIGNTKIEHEVREFEDEGKEFHILIHFCDSTKKYGLDLPNSDIYVNGEKISPEKDTIPLRYKNYVNFRVTLATSLFEKIQKTSKYRKNKNKTLKKESQASQFYEFSDSNSPICISYKLLLVGQNQSDTLIIPESKIYIRYIAKEIANKNYTFPKNVGYQDISYSDDFEKERFSSTQLGSYTLRVVTFPIWILPWCVIQLSGNPDGWGW